MVITVTCPSCSSAFPVDPAKIPEGGVNARCTQCGEVFRIEKPADPAPEPVMDLPEVAHMEEAPVAVEEALPAPATEVPAVAESADDWVVEYEEAEVFTPPAPEPTPEPAATSDPFEEVAPFEEPAAAEEEPAPAADAGVSGFTFGKRDPSDKARRLARVLVSDMIMYNAERHQSALASGTLVQDFEEEIDKSWKEFIDQVGGEMAGGDGRQFWTEALNDILAQGQQVF